jgi:hypothetical protein
MHHWDRLMKSFLIKYILVFLLCVSLKVQGDNTTVAKFTISGYIRDDATGEFLIGTNIYLTELKIGCTTNLYGFYSLTLPKGIHIIKIRYIGYITREVEVNVSQNINMDIELKETTIQGETVTITRDKEDAIIKSTDIGTIRIRPAQQKKLPILFGEQDILKTIQFLPGVAQSKEGDCGFFVRGGNSDQNLILLDEAPVYNAYHLLGFFSVFNSDALKEVKLIKGSAPPKYGGRLSSVLDIQMNEGNSKEFAGNGGIGLAFSRLALQGPINKGRGSYLFSGRRTYADLLLKLSPDEEIKDSRLYFYDFTLKANYKLGEKDRLFLSGYFGRDRLGFRNDFNILWGNRTATLRWNHIFNGKLFLNTSLIYSNFDYDFKVIEDEEDNYDDESVSIVSKVKAINLKNDFQYFLNSNNILNFGLNYIYYTFLPCKITIKEYQEYLDLDVKNRNAHEAALYVSHEFTPANFLKLNFGIRYSVFSVFGPGDLFFIDYNEDLVEFESVAEKKKNYSGLEPRVMANFILNNTNSIKFGYARNYQNIHLLSNSTSGTPLDVWQPSSNAIKPQRSDQVSLGYFKNLANNLYETSLEIYYKDMQNQIDFKNGAKIFVSNFLESELVFGTGWAYGAEFMVKKNVGKLTGWISYTRSKTMRKFHEINDGKPFPARYDRRNDFSIVCLYKINNKWTFSTNWVYYTGNAVTIPYGKYEIEGFDVKLYTSRNGYRMPPYHRMDVGFTYTTKKGATWNFSLYNAYGRRNVYAINFQKNKNNSNFNEAVKLSLFSFFPSITYNFKF